MNLSKELERARDAAPRTTIDLDGIYGRQTRHARTRRIATIGVALTLGLTGVAGVFLAFGQEADRDVAAPRVDLALPSGSYYYERIESYNMLRSPGTPDIETASNELWLASDGSGRFVSDGKIINYYEPFPEGGAHVDATFAAEGSPWDWVDLPADPDAMREALLVSRAPDGSSPAPATPSPGMPVEDWQIMSAAQDLLARNGLYLAPPQRRALFEVLRELPIFDVTTDTVDPVGRAATELSVVVEGRRIRWYFDEATGQQLARVGERASTGEVLTAEITVRQGVVSATSSSDPDPSFMERPTMEEPDFLG